jgi:alkanesulfonate monooxygenase SsuD/methylene tetrahydromethanopterin reductase-like flavin-dependent oxidoreductase (luciferase family)
MTKFGLCLPIFASPGLNLFRTPNYPNLDAGSILGLGRQADQLGYDSLWVADHLMLGKDEAILEGWTVLSALAGATERTTLGMIHQAVFFRNPALAAKMAATLDQISGGRFIEFMDCGYMGREYTSYGFDWDPDVDGRISKLVEALELILSLWAADGPITRDSPVFKVTDAVCTPKPVQQPHPPIWFGEATPGILDACARYGQGWNSTPVSLSEWKNRVDALTAACERAGRSVDEIELSLETQILVARDNDQLRARLREMITLAESQGQNLPSEILPFLASYGNDEETKAFVDGRTDRLPRKMAEDWIVGTPDQVEQRLQEYIGAGTDHFMLWFMDLPRTDGLELFATEVVPRFRSNE